MQRLNLSLPVERAIAISLSGAAFAIAFEQMVDGAALMSDALRIPLFGGLMTLALAMMTLMARVAPLRALPAALALGLLTGGLLWMAGAGSPFAFLERDVSAGTLYAFLVLALLSLPILQSLCLGQGLRYPPIFEASLQIVLTWGTGVIFALLAWGAILAAGELLELVGLPIVESLMDADHLPVALTGLLLGLGCAAFAALPFGKGRVPMMLTRLLAAPFVLVQATFLTALPLHGLSGFDVSPTLLMGWSVLFAAFLVSIIAGADGKASDHGRFWHLVACALIVLMLPMAAVALWAVGIRIHAYGLTPLRIAGLTLALFAALIALGYGASWLRGRFALSVGPTNMLGAGVLLGLAVLLLSGLSSPERMSVRSQLARLDRAETTLAEMPLRAMAHSWGQAGRAGLQTLRARYADDPEALALIETMTTASYPPISIPRPPEEAERLEALTLQLRAQLSEQLVVLPAGHVSAEDFVNRSSLGLEAMRSLLAACKTPTPAGHPGCLAVAGDFLTDRAGEEIILLSLEPSSGSNGRAIGWQRDVAGFWQRAALNGNLYGLDTAKAIDALHQNGPRLRPAPFQVLTLDDQDILFAP